MSRTIPKEYLGAFKAGHPAGVREFIDEGHSYFLLDKILTTNCEESKAALAYISKFNNEYHKDFFKNDEEALHKKDVIAPGRYKEDRWGNLKLKDGEPIPVSQANTCISRANARKRDVISRERKFIRSIEPTQLENTDGIYSLCDDFLNRNRDFAHEDILIELIDLANESNASTKN